MCTCSLILVNGVAGEAFARCEQDSTLRLGSVMVLHLLPWRLSMEVSWVDVWRPLVQAGIRSASVGVLLVFIASPDTCRRWEQSHAPSNPSHAPTSITPLCSTPVGLEIIRWKKYVYRVGKYILPHVLCS